MAYAIGIENQNPIGAKPVERITEAITVANTLLVLTIPGLLSDDQHLPPAHTHP